MDSRLWHTVTEWLFDPTVGKIVTIVAGIVIISVLTRAIRRILLGHIETACCPNLLLHLTELC
jgi:hypothetical protein